MYKVLHQKNGYIILLKIKKRVVLFFLTDSGKCTMPRIDYYMVFQGKQASFYRANYLGVRTAVEVCSPNRTCKERIPNKYCIIEEKTYTTGRVPWCMYDAYRLVSDKNFLVICKFFINLRYGNG